MRYIYMISVYERVRASKPIKLFAGREREARDIAKRLSASTGKRTSISRRPDGAFMQDWKHFASYKEEVRENDIQSVD
jgi:hypothetical protein